jgi:DNA-binding NarL/FixJ family response regulator
VKGRPRAASPPAADASCESRNAGITNANAGFYASSAIPVVLSNHPKGLTSFKFAFSLVDREEPGNPAPLDVTTTQTTRARASDDGERRAPAVVIDTDRALRDELSAVVEETGLAVVRGSVLPEEGVAVAAHAQAAVCLLRVGARDVEIVRALRAEGSTAAIIALADSPDTARAAQLAGASACLLGKWARAELQAALRLVLDGYVVAPRVSAPVVQVPPRAQALLAALSGRERDVVEAFLSERSTAEIAEQLGLSQITVRRHLSRVCEKADVAGRAGLRMLFGMDRSRRRGRRPARSHRARHGTRVDGAHARRRTPRFGEPLSDRELEVLRLVASGAGNREIAEALVIAPSTVKNHLKRIAAKLGARNRAEAAVVANRQGLL